MATNIAGRKESISRLTTKIPALNAQKPSTKRRPMKATPEVINEPSITS